MHASGREPSEEDQGDLVILTRGMVHTFTAALGDLTLRPYYAPFFEFDDTRQFVIAETIAETEWVWKLGSAIKRRFTCGSVLTSGVMIQCSRR